MYKISHYIIHNTRFYVQGTKLKEITRMRGDFFLLLDNNYFISDNYKTLS